VLVAAGTPPAFAQSQSIGVVVAPAEPAREGFLQLEADFSVRPSVTSTTLGAGVQTLDLVVFCVDLFTGQILPFCDVALTPQRVPGSGGHDHDDASRPIGSFDPASGNTGSDGLLPVTYTSPEVSGVVQTTITGVTQDGNPVIPGVFTIGVEITGLVDLGAGTDYDLVGQTGNHGDNHYGTQAFVGSQGAPAAPRSPR
jgi:hypothetical protein